MHDVTMSALHQALRGLSARQRTIADNIANLETPEFLAGRVDFEASLSAAVAGGDPAVAQISTGRSTAATGVNGNNVNLDQETLTMIETDLRYQMTSQAVSNKFGLLRTAIGGGI
jgi:flagellar basal-body rod protein FlgB